MPVQDSLPGKLGPYRILQKIGAGGMGVVYLARDAEGRNVAIKALGPAVTSDPNARRRLMREVETMRRVRSPYVAEILDADVASDAPYIVTRYVPGKTLEEVVRASGPLTGKALAGFAAGLAEALTAIHAAGVVHRDLKPGNVMLVEGRPVVIDFGIAHVADATRLTQTGMVMGTPGYLAPEVIEGQPSSSASDVHSWGATVAYAATGRSPYGAGSYQTIFYRVVTGKPDLTGIPQPIAPMVGAALATSPADRPPTTWLAGQCSALAGAGPNGTMLAPAGTLLARGAGGPNGTLMARGAGGSTLLGPRYTPGPPSPRDAARDVADLLPPADPRARGSNPRAGTALLDRDREAETARADRPESFGGVVAALIVILVALTVLLPVAGFILSLVVITLFRAADYASSSLVLRRNSRGARPSDIVVMVISAPWTIARALLTTVTLAPLAFAVGVAAAVASIVVLRTHTVAEAGAWAAGAVVAWYGAGPGSKRPRRQLGRVVGTVVRSQGVMAVVLVACWALAIAAILQATSQPPLYWPADTGMVPHLPSLSSFFTHSLHSLLHSTSGMVPRVHVSRAHFGTFRLP
jgi:serine/threonine protein kinase